MKLKRTVYPQKTFDDDLDALVRLIVDKGWAFPGLDLDRLATDVEEQRAQRAAHDALEGQYLAAHATFGLEQEARYRRFMKTVYALRGAFCSDKAVMAELDRFRRHNGSHGRKKKEAADAV
jgi:hypothetical protein